MSEQSREFLSLLAHLHLRHGQHARAAALLEALVLIAPEDLLAARSLAYCLLSLDRCQECLDVLDRHPEDESSELRWIRSRALWGLGLREEARAALTRAMQTMRESDGP